MRVTRIKPPTFRVGGLVLNEYELRQLQLEVLKGERQGNIKVKEGNRILTILPDGQFDYAPLGYATNSIITLEMIRIRRERDNT